MSRQRQEIRTKTKRQGIPQCQKIYKWYKEEATVPVCLQHKNPYKACNKSVLKEVRWSQTKYRAYNHEWNRRLEYIGTFIGVHGGLASGWTAKWEVQGSKSGQDKNLDQDICSKSTSGGRRVVNNIWRVRPCPP